MQYLKNDVRQRILTAAVQEFTQYGYPEASIRTIADNAGISLGNVYRYFTNKQALFCAIVEPLLEEIGDIIQQELSHTPQLSTATDNIVEYYWQNSQRFAVLTQSNNYNYDNYRKMLTETAERIIRNRLTFYPTIQTKIQNPLFFNAISGGFLYALNLAIHSTADKQTQKRNIQELTSFFFQNLSNRFPTNS